MAVLANLIYYGIKAAVFAALAYAGIMLGKKFRDNRESEKNR